jgi:hypothetical protein
LTSVALNDDTIAAPQEIVDPKLPGAECQLSLAACDEGPSVIRREVPARADHGALKSMIGPMRVFQRLQTASTTIKRLDEVMRVIR